MSKHFDMTGYVYDPIRGFLPSGDVRTIKLNGLQERFRTMNPLLRTLLVTDGTVTKFLEAYLWEPISVERLLQKETVLDHGMPLLEIKEGERVILRRILLRGVVTHKVYTFAESVVRIHLLEQNIQRDLVEGRLGMGELLRDRRLETYREIFEFGEEKAGEELSTYFEIKEDDSIYFRRYRIHVKGKPVILITEKFFEPHFR